MLKDFFRKIKKLKMPKGSLIDKIDTIKKVPEDRSSSADFKVQLEKTQEEITKKIENLVDSKIQNIKTNIDTVKNLEAQISKIDQIVSFQRKSADEVKERQDKIDETILELSSLYEVVSSTVNPFVSDNQNNSSEKLIEIEKKIGELNKKVSSSNIPEDLDMRFKNLENNLEGLKKIVELNTINEEIMVEKVAGAVLERLKPLIGQKNEFPPTNQQTSVTSSKQSTESSLFENHDKEVKLPYLDNRPETSIILLNWIEYLMEKVGRNNLIDVLEYYVEINWISEDVSSKIIDYANGIDYYVERPTWKLLPEDHTKSLFFIEQLRGRKIDKNSLARLERDVNKIIRSSEVMLSLNKLDL
jgi:flagellar protein FlaD